MKKNILLLLSIAFLFACSSRKSENKTVGLKGFSAYYNTLFNSKDALETELKDRKTSYQDNFYAPYINLLKYEEQPLGSDLNNNGFFGENDGNFSGQNVTPSVPAQRGASTLQIAEAKALKAISKYSVLKDGEEKNRKMFDAHILLAQARLYQNKPLEALDALNYLFSNMKNDKRLDLAKIYQAQAYAKMKDFYRANEVFLALNNSNLNKNYKKLQSVYYAQMLVDAGKKEEAVKELEDAFEVNKNRELRSRIAFLRGQILAQLGKNEEARESFTTAYKYANDFEFEVKSQIEIAKTYNGAKEDYEGARKYIEDISKKGTYASRKNEFYYALGLMANKAGKTEDAQKYFAKALAEKQSDPQLRGQTFYEIGKHSQDKNDYISAGAYYDSALAVMTYQPAREQLAYTSTNIKKVSKNYYLVKKNDSILALTKMSDAQKSAYFGKYIDELKTKEAKEEALRKKEERNKGFDTGDYNANSIFAGNKNTFQDFSPQVNKGGFYFANQNAVSKGQGEFKQIWGSRALQDDWRYSSRMASLEETKNQAMGLEGTQNPRRFETEFYTEKIPTNTEEIAQLKKSRDTASLGLGRMYENYFSNTALATKTLYDLVDNQPEEQVKLQALYQIFSMNYEKNPSAAERAKSMILSEFPYTSYAEFVKNPKNTGFTESVSDVKNAYTKAYELYSQEKFQESQALINSILEKYPKDALVPKFALLNAYNAGKTAGKEIMILQLEQIALNYSITPEGEKASEILKYMKSDISSMEITDKQGNKALNAPVQQTEKVVNVVSETSQPTTAHENPAPKPSVPANNKKSGPPDRPPMFEGSDNIGVGVPEMSPQELEKIKNGK